MQSAEPDPHAFRLTPDPELVARAHNAMLRAETQPKRFVRQRWEETFAATRVALTALREIYPVDHSELGDDDASHARIAIDSLTDAYEALDQMSEGMLGPLMDDVMRGRVADHELFDLLVGGDDDET